MHDCIETMTTFKVIPHLSQHFHSQIRSCVMIIPNVICPAPFAWIDADSVALNEIWSLQ